MVDNEENKKGKRKKKGEGVSSLAQTTFDLPASSLELPILSLQRRRTSLSLSRSPLPLRLHPSLSLASLSPPDVLLFLLDRRRNRRALDAAARWRNRGGKMLQVSTDWGNMAAARTGGRTARRRAGSNFSRRRGRTRLHGRAAASGSPPALLPVSTRSLSLRRALFLLRTPSLSVFPAVSYRGHPRMAPALLDFDESDAKSTTSGRHGSKADAIPI